MSTSSASPVRTTRTVLLTGVTGKTGSLLLPLLEARGVSVRAMVRHPRDAEKFAGSTASIVVGNFDDASSLKAALAGVDSAYLVTPSSANAAAQQIRFVELAAAAPIRQLVKLSQLGAHDESPVRFLRDHAAVESRILDLGLGHTFLRPNLFLQGLLAFRAMIAREGRFLAPIGDARISAVDIRDIAAVAAIALTEPGHLGKTYTLTGPKAVTHGELASALSEAVGRTITFSDVAPAEFAADLSQLGMPPWQVEGLLEDYAHYRRGEAQDISTAVREVTGAEPRSMATFARDYADNFRA